MDVKMQKIKNIFIIFDRLNESHHYIQGVAIHCIPPPQPKLQVDFFFLSMSQYAFMIQAILCKPKKYFVFNILVDLAPHSNNL